MITKQQIVTDLKRFARRHYEYLKRGRECSMHPLRIRKKQLDELHAVFEDRIAALAEEISEYRDSISDAPLSREKGTVLFENFRILSYNGDSMGKVLGRDNCIYRGVYKESVPDFIRLWNSGLLQVLGRNGMIPVTTVTDYYTEEYPIILQHEIVDMSTSKLWNSRMIKDACVTMTVIDRVARTAGFKLYDGHLNNMTFHNGKPVFTDIGSIVENRGQKTAYENGLVFAGLYRLLFSALNNSILKRVQPYDEENNAIWISRRFYDDATVEYYKALRKFKGYHSLRSSILCSWIIFRVFDCYDCRPEYIELLFGSNAQTAERQVCAAADIDCTVKAIKKLDLDAKTAVDIGGTSGELSCALYDRLGLKVISAEYDEGRAIEAYDRFRAQDVPVCSVLFNYLYGADDNTRDYIRSDIAIALDITHNLKAYQPWKPDSLLNSLSKMTNAYAAVTFHPDEENAGEAGARTSAEETERFESVFAEFFSVLLKEEIKNGTRKGFLYVGKRK